MTAPKQSLKSLTFAVLPKLDANPVQERRLLYVPLKIPIESNLCQRSADRVGTLQ